MEQPRPLKNLLGRARFCNVCQVVKHDGPGHKARSGHIYRTLTEDEESELIVHYNSTAFSDKTLSREKLQEQRKAQQSTWEPSQPRGKPDVYRLDFGKHKGKTLETVAAADAGYLAWCVASRLHETRASFKNALVEAGQLGRLLEEAEELKSSKKKSSCGPAGDAP